MTSSNGNIFRVTGPLCGEFTGHRCEIVLRWMPLNITYETAILIYVMTCCRQPMSHYLSQRWPRSMSPYVVTKQQCVKRHAITCPSAGPGEWRIYVSRIWENFKHWYFPEALFLNPAKTTQICDTCVWFRYQQVICLMWAFALICGAGHMVFKTMGILCDCCAFRDLSMPFDMIWMRHEAMIIVTYILIIVHRYELKAGTNSVHVENLDEFNLHHWNANVVILTKFSSLTALKLSNDNFNCSRWRKRRQNNNFFYISGCAPNNARPWQKRHDVETLSAFLVLYAPRSRMNSPEIGPIISFDVFFAVGMKKTKKNNNKTKQNEKQPSCQWFETQWV